MKKLFTLVIALVAMTFCAKAQVTVVLEAHHVWGDGSGYQLLLDADHSTYGTTIPASGALTSSGDVPASVYAEFEYKVPVNADGSLTTTNMIEDGTATITMPAGTYDFCITNPTPGDRMWIASGTYGRQDDFVFEDGKTYHFVVSLNETTGNDQVALTVFNTNGGTIALSSTTIDFGSTPVNSSATQSITVNLFGLTSATATTTAPFSISTNNTTFGTTATISNASSTLYVKYEPTAVVSDNATIDFVSDTVTATVTLSGSGIDCSNFTLPVNETFDNLNSCWQTFNADNSNPNQAGVDAGLFVFSSYDQANDYTQYLVTPMLPSTDPLIFSFDYFADAFGSLFGVVETFKVGTSSTTSDPSAFTWTSDIAASGTTATYDATAPAGTKYIAIQYTSNYAYYLYIDNFSIRAVPSTPTLELTTTSLDFQYVGIGSQKTLAVPVTAYSLTDDITVSATAPFTVSADNSTFGATASLTASSNIFNGTIYVRYAPTAVGTNSDNVTIASTGATSVDIAVSGTGVDCSQAVSTFPWTEDFSGGVFPPICWEIENTHADTTWEAYDYDGMWASCLGTSSDRTEKLITKTLDFSNLTHSILMDIDFMSYYPYISDGTTSFKVYASTDGGATFASTPLWQLSQVGAFTNWTPTSATINLTSLAGQSNVKLAFVYEGKLAQVLFSNINLYAYDAEDIILSEESLSFSGLVGESYVKTVNVTAYNLPEDITVTTTAPFSVSANGTTFNTTTTLPAAGGTLYVKYTAQAGLQTGMVLFSSDIDEETLPLYGSGVDCSTPATLPFTEGFENGLNECWQNIDNDGDGYAWMDNSEYGLSTHDGEGCMISASYINGVGALYPENWLVTPTLAIPAAGATLNYWVAAQDASYPEEYYEVLVSSNGTSFSNFSQIFNETLSTDEFEQRTLSLNAYAGQNINIAFVHKDVTDMYMMKIDDINVAAGTGVNDIENNASIYPNPTKNILNVNATSNINSVEVFNMMGQKVAAYDANDTYTQINTSNLNNGMYLIRINTENGVINQKFTVAR